MSTHLPLLLALAVVALLVYLLWPRPIFVLRIRDRRMFVQRGKVPPGFVRDCEQMMTTLPIPDCEIKGRGGPRPRDTSLRFSKELPERYHQNFRNLWHLNR